MLYYLHPWQWHSGSEDRQECWYLPNNSGSIDLRGLIDCGKAGTAGDNPYAFVASEVPLIGGVLLGSGDLREFKPDGRVKNAWRSMLGRIPVGETLVEWIDDQLHGVNSDPTSMGATPTGTPTTQRNHDIYLQTLVSRKRFSWGDANNNIRVNRLRDVLRRQFEMRWESATNDNERNHALKCLDFECQKYNRRGQDEWKELVHPRLLAHVKGPVPHETTITDDFNRADANPISTGSFAWTDVGGGDWEIVSNVARQSTSGVTLRASRAESDLSSADHYAQCDLVNSNQGTARGGGPCARFASAAETYYIAALQGDGDMRLAKMVTGTRTDLGTSDTQAFTVPETVRVEINGTTLKRYFDGSEVESITDSAISSNTRTGIAAGSAGGSTAKTEVDDFEAEDLGGGGGSNIPAIRNHLRQLAG